MQPAPESGEPAVKPSSTGVIDFSKLKEEPRDESFWKAYGTPAGEDEIEAGDEPREPPIEILEEAEAEEPPAEDSELLPAEAVEMVAESEEAAAEVSEPEPEEPLEEEEPAPEEPPEDILLLREIRDRLGS